MPAEFEVGQRVAYKGLRGTVHQVASVAGAWLYVIRFDNGTGVFLTDEQAAHLERTD